MPHVTVNNTNFDCGETPRVCPVCRHAMEPALLGQSATSGISDPRCVVELLFRCGHQRCNRLFIARYWQKTVQKQPPQKRWSLGETIPVAVERPVVPEAVAALSERFARIYDQAGVAESHSLDELAGMGYRKALEFLIKDYCIYKRPDDKEDILKAMLGPCIEKFVSDERVKQCAKRAAWLGNDETHYLRRWVDKDIKDLKALLRVTIAWIESDLLAAKYLEEMS